MHSPLSSFLVDLVQSHGCGVEDVSITNDSARCMLPRLCLSNGEDHSACDADVQNGPQKIPALFPPSFDMAPAESVVVKIKKVSRWESVTSPKNTERKRSSLTVVIGAKRPTRRPTSAGIPNKKTSSDSTLFLPERKASMDDFSCHNATESPKTKNASFDKLKSASPKRPRNQAKNISALGRAMLLDQL